MLRKSKNRITWSIVSGLAFLFVFVLVKQNENHRGGQLNDQLRLIHQM